jgi:hypothetical protein
MKIKRFVITKDGPIALGATDQFPEGKADEHDEGELRMALASDVRAGIVRLEFGKSIAWLGLPARQARELGYALIQKANELEKNLP